MPKKRGRKRKRKQSAAAKKRNAKGILQAATPRSSEPDVVLVPDELSSPNVASLPTHELSTATPTSTKPLSRRIAAPNRQTAVITPTMLSSPDAVPTAQEPDETLEMKMSSVLERGKNQQELPARLLTNKTVSNVGLVVKGHDPVIDLTNEDDDDAIGNPFQVGQVVFAHLNGLPPWPAIIDFDQDFDNQCFQPSEGTPVLAHVVWLDINKKAWVDIKNVRSFNEPNYSTCSKLGLKYIAALEKAKIAQQLPLVDRRAKFGAHTLT